MKERTLELTDFIQKQFLFMHKNYQSKQELFEDIYKTALEEKFVREDFLDRVTARENEFPTGIQLEQISAAIPHTDPECVLKEFVAIVTLDSPITFQRMDDKSQKTVVEIVFLLGLNQPHTQLTMLQTLMNLMQDQKKLKTLLTIEDKNDMMVSIHSFCQ